MKIESIFRDYDMVISQHPFSVGGVVQDGENLAILRAAVKAHARLLVDISQSAPSQALHTLASVYIRNDYDAVQDSLVAMVESVKFGIATTTRDVKGHLRECHRFVPELWALLRSTVAAALHDPESLWVLNQLCLYLTKVELTRPDLKIKAEVSYLELEDNYPVPSSDAIAAIRPIIQEWMSGYVPFSFPHHGGGSTADAGRDAIMKYALLGSDASLRSMIRVCYHKSEYDFMMEPMKPFQRVSKIEFVPKTYAKLRTISKEPSTLMYFQQGAKDNLYNYIAKNLSWCLDLKRQERNREYARLGSATGAYCTIDLSEASDRVGFALVRDLFCGSAVWPELLGLRSFYTELPSGVRVRLKKYAPMGSALCFPVECLVFAAVCELVARRARSHGYLPVDYSVYGDDITCPSYMYSGVVSVLESLGFKINQSKSFQVGQYRESCGKEYFSGHDISVIKYRGWCPDRMNPCDRDGLVDHANACYGILPHVRTLVLSWMRAKGVLPVFGKDILSNAPTNFHLRSRYAESYDCNNGGYQVVQHYVRVSTSITEYCASDELTLFEWLRAADRRDPLGATVLQLVQRPDRFRIGGGVQETFTSKWT